MQKDEEIKGQVDYKRMSTQDTNERKYPSR